MNDRELLERAARAAGIELGEWMEVGDNYASAFEKCDAENRGSATRRAIVRAAAELCP